MKTTEDDVAGFDFIGSENSLVKDKDALDVEYIPDKLLYREEEMKRITQEVYKPTYLFEASINMMVYGDPGTGKTAIIKRIDEKFNKRLEQTEEENADDIKSIYINCEGNDTPTSFFEALMDSLDVEYSGNMKISECANRVIGHISKEELNVILIMDEIDSLDKRNHLNKVLYRLTRPSEIYDGFEGNISIIAISNDLKIKQSFNDSVASTFGGKKITFDSYTSKQIKGILDHRQEIALKKKYFGDKSLRKIALTVDEDFFGDIRKGIEIMNDVIYKHGEQVDLTNGDGMDEILQDTIDLIKKRDIESFIDGKDLHYMLVLWAYIESFREGEKQFKPIHERYKKLCKYARESLETENGKSHMYVRRRLDELDENNIINKNVDRNGKGTVCKYSPLVSFYLLEDAVEKKMKKDDLIGKLRRGRDLYKQDNELSEDEKQLLTVSTTEQEDK